MKEVGRHRIIFDENSSHKLSEALRFNGADGEIKHVRDLKFNGIPDDIWIPKAQQIGYAIISSDRNEKTRGLTSEQLVEIGCSCTGGRLLTTLTNILIRFVS